jgi:hypothetical protein
LESPLYWQDFHERFIAYAAEALQPQLPPRYRARINERVVLEAVERAIIPDVTVIQRAALGDRGVQAGESGITSMAVEVDDPMLFSAFADDLREAFVEIIDRLGQRVITIVELLSPANKTPGAGREQYLQKQEEVLRSQTNLVEIDLLHEGPHTIAVPHTNLVRHGPFYGLVNVRRAAQPLQCEVYFVRLPDRLPRIRIPLLPEDHDVALDLPAIFTHCYDAARYDLDVDYTQPPPLALSPAEHTWVEHWLHEKGRRT